MGSQRLVEKHLLVGRDDGVGFRDLHTDGIFAVDNTDYLIRVLAQLGILRTVHDTLSIEGAQTVGDNADIVVG